MFVVCLLLLLSIRLFEKVFLAMYDYLLFNTRSDEEIILSPPPIIQKARVSTSRCILALEVRRHIIMLRAGGG